MSIDDDTLPPTLRRLEVPVLLDVHGTAWAAGVLDVTLRHDGRVLLAEAPPPGLSPEAERTVRATAASLAQGTDAAGVVTVSFAADPASGEVRFMGTAPRLPPEHAAVEALTGLDLAGLQQHLARGGTFAGPAPEPRGTALQICLSARDPEAGFAPSPGIVEVLRLPAGAGLRADAVVEEGEALAAEGDMALVRLTAWARGRNEALTRLQAALGRTAAVLRGGATDKAFLTEILDRLEAGMDEGDPGWVDRMVARGEHLPRRGVEAALLAAAVAEHEAELAEARARFYAAAERGRPEVPREIGRAVELSHRGHAYVLRVARLEPDLYRVAVDGACLPLRVGPAKRTGRRLTCGTRSWQVGLDARADGLHVEVDGVPHRIGRDAGIVVRALAPAVVVSAVPEGAEVAAGETLAVLETMKVETALLAPAAGRVRKVLARRHAQVGIGVPLLVLEPADVTPESAAGERVRFSALTQLARSAGAREEGPASRALAALAETRRLVLGYDVDPGEAGRLLAEAKGGRGEETRRAEEEVLDAFADLVSLMRAEEYFFTFLRGLDARGEGLPPAFLDQLRRALAHYGVASLDRSPELEESLLRIVVSHQRLPRLVTPVLAVLERLLEGDAGGSDDLRALLDRLIAETQGREPAVHDLAREARWHRFDRPLLLAARERSLAAAEADLVALAGAVAGHSRPEERAARIRALVECTQPLHRLLSGRSATAPPELRRALLEVMVRRYYRIRELAAVDTVEAGGQSFAAAEYLWQGSCVHLLATHVADPSLGTSPERSDGLARAAQAIAAARALAEATPDDGREVVVDLYAWEEGQPAEFAGGGSGRPRGREMAGEPGEEADEDATAAEIGHLIEAAGFPARTRRIAVTLAGAGALCHFTWRRNGAWSPGDPGSGEATAGAGWSEERVYRGLHPMMVQRLQVWRLGNFALERLPSPEEVWLYRGVAHENRRDERLFAIAEVRDFTAVRDASGRVVELPELEHMLMEALAGIRRFQSRRAPAERLHWNRVLLYVWPPVDLSAAELAGIVRRLAPGAEGLGLEKVAVRWRMRDERTGELLDRVLEISNPGEAGMVLRVRRPKEVPLKPLREYAQKVVERRRRGLVYAYEIARLLAPHEAQEGIPAGAFKELDLAEGADGAEGDVAGGLVPGLVPAPVPALVPVDRPLGGNTANVVVGLVRNFTARHPEGMERVILIGDAGRGMGSLAEPECRRILAALNLAAERRVPLEWFALSSGARIAMDSGTENMDWIARVLRRIVELTQDGLEINVVVIGINAGAQPYWNAEATMLMHTRGILVMTPEGAMVLTGKQALDYSGGVSAEDDFGTGGYERIMGPNGQAQYFARDIGDACRILLRHYEHTWVAPGERFPRRAATSDPRERDVGEYPHGGAFATVGEVFSEAANPGRKKPFEIRRVMAAVADQDHEPLERWPGMRDAEVAVVWDAHLGGWPVALLGFESKPLPRLGLAPVHGPDHWTGGTLFPLASKKVARAINAASGNRPLVVLANLSGFDGSPESMRLWQLEHGAEIGRAVVNFRGPIVFCVVSRYHGGAFVVFSGALNDNLEVAALEGAHASVIGGAPAAAVVFAGEVDRRTAQDPRIAELEAAMADPARPDRPALAALLEETRAAVRSEKLGEVAGEFDRVHGIERALAVGSVHRILPVAELRPYLIDTVERGMAKELTRLDTEAGRQGRPARPGS